MHVATGALLRMSMSFCN